ncbi:MAG TPA: DUF418 domain-containing protein [Chryseolinea sp.]|nr:DUF418 domain-containing protein [Chryseolinea sp.]
MSYAPHAAVPIAERERTGVVDALRGFALLGVLLANLISFVVFPMPKAVIEQASAGPLNHYYELLVTIFIDNKFVTLFSLLFGYGFGVLMDRVAAKGIDATTFYFRRMAILFALGFVHIFFWWGEILHIYSICGLLMLFFRNAGNRSLLASAAFLLLVPYIAIRYLMIQLKAFDPAISEAIYAHYLEDSLRPGLSSVLVANWNVHLYIYVQCIYEWVELTQALSKFLMGYWVLRVGILTDLRVNRLLIKRALYVCGAVAVIYTMETAWFNIMHPKINGTAIKLLIGGANRIGILSLSLTYACLISLWYDRRSGSRILKGFRFVGMMSLTNYLTHTVIYVILLHGIGWGMMGKLSIIETLYIGLFIYPIQVAISVYWLKRYRYGPVEWVWRQLSYGKHFPIRKPARG